MRNELVADFAILCGVALLITGLWMKWGFATCALAGGPLLIIIGIAMGLYAKGDKE